MRTVNCGPSLEVIQHLKYLIQIRPNHTTPHFTTPVSQRNWTHVAVEFEIYIGASEFRNNAPLSPLRDDTATDMHLKYSVWEIDYICWMGR